MRSVYKFIIVFLLSSLFSCTDHTPKPQGYVRIERPKNVMMEKGYKSFSFFYSSDVLFEVPQVDKTANEEWFNIVYPDFHSSIYCTYMPVLNNNFSEIMEDNYRFVYSHVLKSDGISQKVFSFPNKKVYGVIYEIEGSVATPLQFYATDSVSHFLRGSLYLEQAMNVDSVAPIISIIRSDIENLLNTLKWK